MESAALVLDALGRVRDMVRAALKDLSPKELLAPPKPHIAWLVWHLSRVKDTNFSGLLERQQLWIADGWHARFNMRPIRATTAPAIDKLASKSTLLTSPTKRSCSITWTRSSRRRNPISQL